MPTFSWTVTGQIGTRIANAFAEQHHYDDNKLPGETKAQFADRMVKQYIKSTVARHEASVAAATAARTAETAAMSEIEIT